jgi:uncharacterized membrane protein
MPLSQLLPGSADMNDPTPILPAHIEETIQAIARLQAEHRRNATPLQHNVERVTALIGRTTFVGGLTVVMVLWVGGNLLAGQLHLRAPDPPPFSWLQGAAAVLALYITVFILSTQRRENELSELREQLNLELVITNEQKTAKVIQLLEELRRDMPQVANRYDPEAAAMALPANPEVMLEAIKETQEIGLPSDEAGADALAELPMDAAPSPPPTAAV